MKNNPNINISVIGLGYVGLPLAVEFGKKYSVIGYDISKKRVDELKTYVDVTNEIETSELKKATHLKFSDEIDSIRDSNIFIITVPTPINENKQPDLKPLLDASENVGSVLKKGDLVIFESTVYPGATEEDCVPVLEKKSNLKFNHDFFVGYSPERINPGDKQRKLKDILKVTSGSNPDTANQVDELYGSIIEAGTFKATSIKVAEGSKIIENVQRDVNIALINEFHQIFTNLGIDINDVIDAASTKWNFMELRPGLVGGHCIGVDPYYLMHKSNERGYVPDLMRTAREINDSMSTYLVNDFVKNLLLKGINPLGLDIALLGFSFKKNCPDIRNTKVFDLYRELEKLKFNVKIYDPLVDPLEAKRMYGVELENDLDTASEKVAFLSSEHDEMIKKLSKFDYVYDFKGTLNVK